MAQSLLQVEVLHSLSSIKSSTHSHHSNCLQPWTQARPISKPMPKFSSRRGRAPTRIRSLKMSSPAQIKVNNIISFRTNKQIQSIRPTRSSARHRLLSSSPNQLRKFNLDNNLRDLKRQQQPHQKIRVSLLDNQQLRVTKHLLPMLEGP